ncbi:5 -3 exoribonuclease 2, partial [Brachionus plicatilis]
RILMFACACIIFSLTDIELSGGIAGKVWLDEYVCLEGETYKSPLRFVSAVIPNNHVLSVHYHDPVYDSEYVFKTAMLQGAIIPESTLKPEDFQQHGYRPRYGFNNQSRDNYRQNRTATVANRIANNSLANCQMSSSLMSSAHGGNESFYGSYKSSSCSERHSSQYQQNKHYSSNNYNNNNNNHNNNYNNNSYNYNNRGTIINNYIFFFLFVYFKNYVKRFKFYY